MPQNEIACAQYHIAEYNQLRQELLQNFKDSYSSVTYSVFANALLVAWISSHVGQVRQIDTLIKLACGLPLLISLVAWTLYLLRRRSIQRIADYCALLEKEYALGNLGWERFFRSRLKGRFLYIRSAWVLNTVCLTQVVLSVYFIYFMLTIPRAS
jgi:hypothetical protein